MHKCATGVILRITLNIDGGLGAKVPLSYTDHFYIETYTIENNTNFYRKWVQYIDSTRIGIISLLNEEVNPSNFKQGTKIIIAFERKDFAKLITSLNWYLTYTKSNYTLLNKEVLSDLELRTIDYNYYGKNWSLLFKDRNFKQFLVVVEGIPYKLDINTLFDYFNNSKDNLDYILKSNKPKFIKEEENKKLFKLYLEALKNFSFELHIPIGTCDLSASRESLQYTDKTCIDLYKRLYLMFCEFYKNICIDTIYNTDIFDGAKKLCSTPSVFYNLFSKHMLWYKNSICLNGSHNIFSESPISEYRVYKLDSTYSKKSYKYQDVIKNTETNKVYISDYKYIICVQDTQYVNYSKYIKHYLVNNINQDKYYSVRVICVKPNDYLRITDWLKETCLTFKLSELVSVYNKDCPTVKTERIDNALFKSYILTGTCQRPRAQHIYCYTKEELVSKTPDVINYYLEINKLSKLNIFGKINSGVQPYEFIANLFTYFKCKNLKGGIYITDKYTKNYNNKNWVNLFNIIEEDCKLYNIHPVEFTGDLVTTCAINIFKYKYLNTHLSILSTFDNEDLNASYYYSYIYNIQDESRLFLRQEKVLYSLIKLFNFDVYRMEQCCQKTYLDKLIDFRIPEFAVNECTEFYNLSNDYINKLPFLRAYNLLHKSFYCDLKLENEDYLKYIKLMEKELGLIKKNSDITLVNKEPVSEFKLLYDRLSS